VGIKPRVPATATGWKAQDSFMERSRRWSLGWGPVCHGFASLFFALSSHTRLTYRLLDFPRVIQGKPIVVLELFYSFSLKSKCKKQEERELPSDFCPHLGKQ